MLSLQQTFAKNDLGHTFPFEKRTGNSCFERQIQTVGLKLFIHFILASCSVSLLTSIGMFSDMIKLMLLPGNARIALDLY